MKRKPIVAFLVCMLLLAFVSFGQTQVPVPIIAPPDIGEEQLAVEILMGLMGNYLAKVQEYQDAIAQGGAPDSVMEFRLAAKVVMTDGDADSESGAVLTEMSRMAFWLFAERFR